MNTGGDTPMAQALAEAEAAARAGEVPVGAVLVDAKGAVIAAAGNRTRTDNDPTAHAEIVVIRAAAAALGAERLNDCDLYVTLEPCPMCAGALVNSRIARLVFGAVDSKGGACGSLFDIPSDPRVNHRIPITRGVLADESATLLRAFFGERRRIAREAREAQR